MNERSRARSVRLAGIWLALGVALLCLLTAGGSMTSIDPVIAYDVTRGIVERHSLAMTDSQGLNEAYRGVGGQYYSPFGVAQSVWNIPFYVAGRAAARRVGAHLGPDVIPKAAVALATVPAVAILAWVCFELLITLGATPTRAVTTALLVVCATPVWPYSGFGFNQPLTGMFLWAAVLAAASSEERWLPLLTSGVCAGLALLTRHEMAVAAGVIGVYIAWRAPRSRLRSIAAYASGLVPMILIWALVNYVRFGNPIESGYLRDPIVGFGHSLLVGGAGLLFSPYASVFLYAPIVVLSVAGIRAMWRRDPPTATLFVALFVCSFAVYASLGNWMGGRSYGPRYLVPLIPALVLPLAFWTPRAHTRALAAAIVAISVVVQIPGVMVDYAKVRVEHARAGDTVAQDNRWEGLPLLLNARATWANGTRALRFLGGLEEAPRVARAPGDSFSQALSFSLDLWWLYLAYLGIIGRAAAIAIAVLLAAASGFAIVRSYMAASAAAIR
jgi:hypothetical protein